MRILSAVSIVLAAGVFAGCAAKSAMAPAEPAADPAGDAVATESETMDFDSAALDFERAEQQLDGLLAEAGPATPPVAGQPAPQVADDGAGDAVEQSKPTGASSGGRCARACGALGSMKRSADRLCELTGADDPRCGDVTARYRRAEERVQQACSNCSRG